jgi:alpha-beta hydrolase superfamily lysophospholipase
MMKIETHVLNDIFAQRFQGPNPRYALLISHGTGGHSGIYNTFCEHHAAKGVDVWAYDAPGHGRSTMTRGRGDFRLGEWVEACVNYAAHIRAETDLPVISLGSSLGCSVAFSCLYSEDIIGAVLMGGRKVPSSAGIPADHPLRSKEIDAVEESLGRSLRFDIERFVNFDTDYGFSGAGEQKHMDPFNTWMYDFASWRSVFTYEPRIKAAQNQKPILYAVGQKDILVPAEESRLVARSIAGPVRFEVLDGAGHQLMLFETKRFSALIEDWTGPILSLATKAKASQPIPKASRAG